MFSVVLTDSETEAAKGIAVAASRVGSAASTFRLPVVEDSYGTTTALGGCVVVLLLGGFVCWAWAPETSRE